MMTEIATNTPPTTGIRPTEWQSRVLMVPEAWNLLIEGSKGPGKTHAMALRVLRHLVKYGPAAKVLFARQTYKGLATVEELMVNILEDAFPTRIRYNRSEHILRIVEGGTVEFAAIESHRDLDKMAGRETTLLCVDEFGQLRDPRWVNQLKANLRSPENIPLATILTANPGGANHVYCQKTFINAAPPWHDFKVDGETWIRCPGTYLDNPFLNHRDYELKIRAACGNDEELVKALLLGSWSIAKGAFFGSDFDEKVHVIPESLPFAIDALHRKSLSMDWGMSAPAVCLFGGYASGDIRGIAKGSLVIFDEMALVDRTDATLNRGLNWPPSKCADEILTRCRRWNMHPQGVCDDAVGLSPGDTLIERFRSDGIAFSKPTKGRASGLAAIRSLLQQTKERTGRPGLLISARCWYLLQTLPMIQRDPIKSDDIDTNSFDHAIDALSYMVRSPLNDWYTVVNGKRMNYN